MFLDFSFFAGSYMLTGFHASLSFLLLQLSALLLPCFFLHCCLLPCCYVFYLKSVGCFFCKRNELDALHNIQFTFAIVSLYALPYFCLFPFSGELVFERSLAFFCLFVLFEVCTAVFFPLFVVLFCLLLHFVLFPAVCFRLFLHLCRHSTVFL